MTLGEKVSVAGGGRHAESKEILRRRAIALARRPEQAKDAGEILEVVEFRLARERYALEQKYVGEVQVLKALTPLPGAPAFLRGIINIRGQILSVIDIKKFFELPESGIDDLHMVIVVQAGGMEVGILADAIEGVRSIASGAMQNTLPTLTGIRAKYLKGVTDGNVAVLDVWKMLTDSALAVDERIE